MTAVLATLHPRRDAGEWWQKTPHINEEASCLLKLGDGQILHLRERRMSSTRPPTPLCCIYDGSSGRLSVAVVQVKREAEDLLWDYQDVASDLRRSDGTGTDLPDVGVIC